MVFIHVTYRVRLIPFIVWTKRRRVRTILWGGGLGLREEDTTCVLCWFILAVHLSLLPTYGPNNNTFITTDFFERLKNYRKYNYFTMYYLTGSYIYIYYHLITIITVHEPLASHSTVFLLTLRQ